MGTNEQQTDALTVTNGEQEKVDNLHNSKEKSRVSYDMDIDNLVRAAFGVSEMLLEMAEACEVTDFGKACAYEGMHDILYNASKPFLDRNSFGSITGTKLES